MQPNPPPPAALLKKNYDSMKEGDLLAIMDGTRDSIVMQYGSFIYCDVHADDEAEIHYIPRYMANGAPIACRIPQVCFASHCQHAEEVIKQTIFEARKQLTALNDVLIKIGSSVC